jgi:ribonucleoside-diphosphate reductase alpha chain
LTHKFSVGGYEGYLTIGLYPDTKQPGEAFIVAAKEGSTVSGLLDTIATLISMCLQSGMPLKTLVRKFKDMNFGPAGFTNNPEIPMAKSITDYVFRYLGIKFLSPEDREEIFGMPLAENKKEPAISKTDSILADLLMPSVARTSQPMPVNFQVASTRAINADAPACQCGTLMIRAGACWSCPNCFATSGVCN